MDAGSIIGLVVVLIACVAFALLYEEPTIKGTVSTIDELPTQTLLMGSTLWQITILRKSGYLHDVREVLGDADEAISKALTSCRRSGIYSIIITKNEPAILEFYSANQDGRGKAIGGFRITRREISPSASSAHQVEKPDYKSFVEAAQKARTDLEFAAQKYKPKDEKQKLIEKDTPANEPIEPIKYEPPAAQSHHSIAEDDGQQVRATPLKPVDYKSIVEAGKNARAELEVAAQKYSRTSGKNQSPIQLESLAFELVEAKRALAKTLLDSVKPTLGSKQLEVLGLLTDDELISSMADQITGEESNLGEPFTFLIPIHFTDSDGTYYENMRLVVTHSIPTTNLTESNVSRRIDTFGFPEQDAWEGSVYEIGGRPFRCDVKLGFRYTDSNGATTNRQIRTKAFVPWLDEDNLVLGFCNYRKANRSFSTSRMEEVVNLETGEYLADVDRFLTETYEASDYKKVDDFIDNRMNVVECLIYLARLDGNLTKAQKELINGYISEASGVAIVTDTVANSLIKDFADDLTPQKFRKLISQMRKNQPDNLVDLLDLGVRVVGARRGNAAGGTAALAAISGTKG